MEKRSREWAGRAAGFIRGWRLWVRWGARPKAAGDMRNGWDVAARVNEGRGRRPSCAEAQAQAVLYLMERSAEALRARTIPAPPAEHGPAAPPLVPPGRAENTSHGGPFRNTSDGRPMRWTQSPVDGEPAHLWRQINGFQLEARPLCGASTSCDLGARPDTWAPMHDPNDPKCEACTAERDRLAFVLFAAGGAL